MLFEIMGGRIYWAGSTSNSRMKRNYSPRKRSRTKRYGFLTSWRLLIMPFPLDRAHVYCGVRPWSGQKFLEDRLNAEDHDLILQMGNLPGFVQIIAPVTLAWRRHAYSETAEFASTVAGNLRLVTRENSGVFPGGSERSKERRRILTRYTRPVSIHCLRHGLQREAWQIYRATFCWNVSLWRVKYLLAFPLLALMSHVRAAIPPGAKWSIRL